MAQIPIKRYALVPTARNGSVTNFHLARVERLERMEEIAAREQARRTLDDSRREPHQEDRPTEG